MTAAKMITILTLSVALALGALTIAAFAGDRLGWPFDLAQHFRPHVVVATILLALLGFFVLDGVWLVLGGLLAGAILIAGITPVAGALRYAGPAEPTADFLRIKVAHANLWGRNRQYERFVDWVRSERPDILVVTELHPEWAEALGALRDLLPYQRLEGTGDVGILSVWPWQAADVADRPPGQISMVRLDTPAGPLLMIGTHPVVPARAPLAGRRDRLIGFIAEQVRAAREPVIVAGDFNATPWCGPMRKLVDTTSLHYGPGAWVSTWPVSLPRPFGVAIDHILSGNGCRVVDRWHGEQVGSDHWPVVARVHCRRIAGTSAVP